MHDEQQLNYYSEKKTVLACLSCRVRCYSPQSSCRDKGIFDMNLHKLYRRQLALPFPLAILKSGAPSQFDNRSPV